MKDLDEVRKIFLTEVDEETRVDNERKIQEWEQSLIHNEALLSWKEHDITKSIASQAKEQYREIGLILALNRRIKDEYRVSLWAKQDAMAWLLSLTERDPKAELEQVHKEIKAALDATK